LTRRLHSIGGVAPWNRPVQSPRQPTGLSGVGLKSSEPKDGLIRPDLLMAEAGTGVCPEAIWWLAANMAAATHAPSNAPLERTLFIGVIMLNIIREPLSNHPLK